MRLIMEIELKNYKVPQYMNKLIDSLKNPDIRMDPRYVFHRASVHPLPHPPWNLEDSTARIVLFFIPFDLCH